MCQLFKYERYRISRDKRVLEYWIKDRFFIEPWRSRVCRSNFTAILCRGEERKRGEGRKHGIIPRDFRSEYSLAGHSFQSVTFATVKRVEQFLLSLDDRGPRRHDNKVSTFTDPGLVSDHRFRVMLVRITMPWCIRSTQSRSIVYFLRWWSVRMKRADLERDCCEILSSLILEKL